MDDPILRLLVCLRLSKPKRRMRGDLEPPIEDLREPMRTERALARPLTLWRLRNGGDEHDKLSFWLLDACALMADGEMAKWRIGEMTDGELADG
jgi:hypothetical protein